MKKQYVFTKEMIKSVRLIKGYKTDCRVVLTGIDKGCMWDFIDEIFPNLFGSDFTYKKYETVGSFVLSKSYESAVWQCVNAVIDGNEAAFYL